MTRLSTVPARAWAAAAAVLALGIAAVAGSGGPLPASPPKETTQAMPPGVGMPGGPPTSVDGLQGRVAQMEARLAAQPDDVASAVLLADALLRQARAAADGRAAGRAATVLERALRASPGTYDARRLLGATYLSLHRFADALAAGRQARDMRPDDAWNYGVMGDAQLELGDYPAAFASFDRMMQLRPGPGAYARAAYARELSGDPSSALAAMQMAWAATPAQDPEAQAWYATQMGELQLKLGRLHEADREFRRAQFVFPAYPLAVVGTGKVRLAQGDSAGALAVYLDQFGRTPTLDLAARIGDLYADSGRAAVAAHYFQLAEELAGPVPAQTEATLALFLADHDRELPQAVALAERVAAVRHDIATDHALAWAYYKAGRVDDAAVAMRRAMRTGSRDPVLMAHAAAIEQARARGAGATH